MKIIQFEQLLKVHDSTFGPLVVKINPAFCGRTLFWLCFASAWMFSWIWFFLI